MPVKPKIGKYRQLFRPSLDPSDNEFTISSEFQHIVASIYVRDSNSYFSQYTQSVEKNENLLTGIAADDIIDYGAGGQEYTSPIDEPAYIHPGYFLSTNAFTFIEFDMIQNYPTNNRANISLDSLLKVSGSPDFYKIIVTSPDVITSGGESTLEVYLSTLNDFDNDGLADHQDDDDDNDGYHDDKDIFPLNSEEWKDTDMDGIGNNSDPDIDGDGYANEDDPFPEEKMCANEYETTNGECIFEELSASDVQAADNTGIIYIIDRYGYKIQRWNSNTARLIEPIPLEYSEMPSRLVYSAAQNRLYLYEDGNRTSVYYIDNPSSSVVVHNFIYEEDLGLNVYMQAMNDVLFIAGGNDSGDEDWTIKIYDKDKAIIDNYKVSHENGPHNPIWFEGSHSLITGFGDTYDTTRIYRTDFSEDFTEQEFVRSTLNQNDSDLLPLHISEAEIFFANGQKMMIETLEITDPISVNFDQVLYADEDQFIIIEERYDGDFAMLYNHENELMNELKGDSEAFQKAIRAKDSTVVAHKSDNYTLHLTVINN